MTILYRLLDWLILIKWLRSRPSMPKLTAVFTVAPKQNTVQREQPVFTGLARWSRLCWLASMRSIWHQAQNIIWVPKPRTKVERYCLVLQTNWLGRVAGITQRYANPGLCYRLWLYLDSFYSYTVLLTVSSKCYQRY